MECKTVCNNHQSLRRVRVQETEETEGLGITAQPQERLLKGILKASLTPVI